MFVLVGDYQIFITVYLKSETAQSFILDNGESIAHSLIL